MIDLVADRNGDVLLVRVQDGVVFLDAREESPLDPDTAEKLANLLRIAATMARRGDRTVRNFPETPAGGTSTPTLPQIPCVCCDHADEYNGFGSDGPRRFTCPLNCTCHD